MKKLLKKYNELDYETKDRLQVLGFIVIVIFFFSMLISTCAVGAYAIDKTCIEIAKSECREASYEPGECRDHVCSSCNIGCHTFKANP